MAADEPRCDFWSLRSRLLWRTISVVGGAVFLGYGIAGIVGENGKTLGAGFFVFDGFCLLLCVGLFVNSYFSGHLTLTRDRLTYRAFLLTRSYGRHQLLRAEIQARFSPPSPRRFNMPVIFKSDGSEYRLTELNTPLATDLYVLKSEVRVKDSEEVSQESLDGVADWINSWIASEDWIQDRETSIVDG